MIINLEHTTRQEARIKLQNTLTAFEKNGAVTQDVLDHYNKYLVASAILGEADTTKTPWDEHFNHRAKEGDPCAIDGTHSELIFEAVMHSLDSKVNRVTDKTMQMYGQDFEFGREKYSIKSRRHNRNSSDGFVFDLFKSDFSPGLFRITHLVFVDIDAHWMTFFKYRNLLPYCCTVENNLCKELNLDKLDVNKFEQAFPAAVNTLELDYLWNQTKIAV